MSDTFQEDWREDRWTRIFEPSALEEFNEAINTDMPRLSKENPVVQAWADWGRRDPEGFKADKNGMMEILAEHRCPRCWGLIPNNRQPGEYPGALSRLTRTDNEDEWVYVCSRCGTEEAMEEFNGRRATPMEQWPIRRGGGIGRYGYGSRN